ncbi:Uncharacterised protein [Mycobacteroides abscessus subsp. abscessus]|nr:Uncharacterised protein [Mycobacteroides abscessus subsp. abscessus]
MNQAIHILRTTNIGNNLPSGCGIFAFVLRRSSGCCGHWLWRHHGNFFTAVHFTSIDVEMIEDFFAIGNRNTFQLDCVDSQMNQ